MRIGIDIRAIGKKRTGDETYAKNLIKNLLKIDQKNQYFLYTDTDKENQKLKIKNQIDPGSQYKNYQIISIKPAHKLLWTFYSLPKYLKKNPVDVLHLQYITPQLLTKKTRLITTIHDVSFNVFPQYIKKSDLFFLKILIPLSLKKANEVIAVSRFTKKEIARYYKIPENKIRAIYNGGAGENFIKLEEKYSREAQKAKEKYSLPDNFIFYAGTLQPRKNIPFLLEGFKRLKSKYRKKYPEIKNLKLVLSGQRGGHNYDSRIDKKLQQIKTEAPDIFKDIIFLGFVGDKELPYIYQYAKVFCYPSLYEGFGLPIIEAMAARTAVLCSFSSCHKEIAQSAASYFNPNDLKDFTKKLYGIIINNKKRKEAVSAGKKRAYFFSWAKTASETLKLYNELKF